MLHALPGVGEKTLAALLREIRRSGLSAGEILALTPDETIQRLGLKPETADHLYTHRRALVEAAAETARALREFPLTVLALDSATYPDRLTRNEPSPPPVLYLLGNAALLSDRSEAGFTFTIAVSNGADQAALSRLDSLASKLCAFGGIPVTGHDRAPYQRMALAAQRGGLPTVYVFDRGLRDCLGPRFDRPPFASARIREAAFAWERDLAISPFRIDDHCLGANNRRRDDLVFALADRIVALDVKAGGAMMEGCRAALAAKRPVYVAEGGREGAGALQAAGAVLLPADAGEAARIVAGGEARTDAE
jgi:predicted Rossmann fold nucleotide-binding protein DprA/Smf involved in DNA uptake